MYLSKILIQNFRSYEEKIIEFSPYVNLIIGPNGSGKTNILESIYFLSSGKSFRASSQGKMINWTSSFASVRGKLNKSDDITEIEVRLIRDPHTASLSRKFYLSKINKPRKIYLGQLQTVAFHPEDIRLVTGSPSRRRDLLDEVFAVSDWRYSSALTQYNKALKHRNELLDLIRIGKSGKSELFYWDQSLVKNDKIIHDYRTEFIRHLNSFFYTHENSEIRTISLNYHPSVLSQEKLDQSYPHDLSRGFTQSGAHRDDFSFDNSIFPSSDQDLANWGSRGQQRLAVLALRLGQINYLEEKYGDKPILLLDDIFSELDLDHQQLVVNICRKYQTIITAATRELVGIMPSSNLIELPNIPEN